MRTIMTGAAWICACLMPVLAMGPGAPPNTAMAQVNGLPGDVNLDGEVNVLDVQASVNQALLDAPATPEADVDLDLNVSVLDVQTITNTALGTGGLVQQVTGRIVAPDAKQLPADLWLVAVSTDGRIHRAPLSPETGDFIAGLDVRAAWSIVIVDGPGQDAEVLGTVLFPLGDGLSTTLPLPNLSRGGVLDLGQLPLQFGATVAGDIRDIIALTSEPIRLVDEDGNGASDILEDLLLPLPIPDDPTLELLLNAIQFDELDLIILLDECLADAGITELEPDLSGGEEGVPDAFEPIYLCIEATLVDWLLEVTSAAGGLLENSVREFAGETVDELRGALYEELLELEIPELFDEDSDFVPDYIEDILCFFGEPTGFGDDGACFFDEDDDGVPDFAEDFDGDGIPNFLDRDDALLSDDDDGDGILNADDIDDDNDGIPDYADNAA